MENSPPRLRLTSNVDLSRAKNHSRCNGTGVVGYRELEDPTAKGEMIKVPIVCRCVTRRGGVKKDAFDRMAAELEQQLVDGTFSENLANDIRSLPPDAMIQKIAELKKTVADAGTDQRVKTQIAEALEILEKEA